MPRRPGGGAARRGAGGGEPGGVRLRDVGRGHLAAPAPHPHRPTDVPAVLPDAPFPCTPEVSSTSTTAPAPWCAAASSWDGTCSAPARRVGPAPLHPARRTPPPATGLWRASSPPGHGGRRRAGGSGAPGKAACGRSGWPGWPPWRRGGLLAAESRRPAGPAAPAPSAEAEGSWRPPIWGTAWSPPWARVEPRFAGRIREARRACRRLKERGVLLELSPGHLLHAGAVRAAEARLRGRFGPAPFSLAEARDALGCSRRCALLLLEHWDASGVTRRQGEGRIFSTSA
ncbi:MAG: SelB C-terminal domain-containing protein [Flavonifractor plautii]